ncbi:hypothetical protein N2152v2_002801, partial [Parachlorella kessleri]
MLDSKASVIDKEERPEVLQLLGDVEGLRIVELGAGIGRFTGELARTADSVLAIDFMENLIEQNKANNGDRENVQFRVADVTELELQAGAYDLVFSNWLLMYLSDDEVAKLAANLLSWVCEGGHIFFRESCFRQSGDKKRANNPTHYRNPREYFRIFDDVEIQQEDGRFAHFELVYCKCVDTYVRVKQNQNQVCWKFCKVVRDGPREIDYRHHLDGTQYSSSSIARYERVFGSGYISTGGAETTKEFTAMLRLQPDEQVLDVGCGIGGGDFFMATTYGCYVYGIDLSVNAVLSALERAAARGNDLKVSFEISDCTKRKFPEDSFDVVYSRDTILHIHDKAALFARLFKVLKPGGRLLITDYCRGAGEASEDFRSYIDNRKYDLQTVEEYAALLRQAGFVDVMGLDKSSQFSTCLSKELADLEQSKEAFIRDFSLPDYNE